MKKKSKKQALRKKKEFRYHNVNIMNLDGKTISIKHPTYVFLEKGNLYFYVVITHSNHVKDYLVIELRENSNPNDSKKSYWVAEVKEDTKDRFKKKEKDWKINQDDDNDIRNFYKKNR